MNLGNLLSSSSLEVLNNIKEEERQQYEADRQRAKEKRLKFLEENCFKTRQEVIDYVKAGHKLYEEESGIVQQGYMVFDTKLNKVGHYSMQYDKDCDMPLGYSWTFRTWDEFVAWTSWMDNTARLEQGYIHYWVKDKTIK